MDEANKLLIVDGSRASVDSISRWLRDINLQIFSADSGLNVMAKLAFLQPHIVVINVNLPDMSGFDLCKKIKQEAEDVLILCVSGLESEINRLRADEMGADDYYELNGDHYLFVSKIRLLIKVWQLRRQLRLRYTELEEKTELLNKQLEMGRQVQRALIPEINTHIDDCEVVSRYFTNMEVSGDFFSLLPLSDDRFGIVMGDVSGHGVAAAFITALLNMMIKNIAVTHPEPDALLYHLNNEMCDLFEQSESSMYACVFYALIDTAAQEVRYANAGQCLPFHVDNQNDVATELNITGRPVGMTRDYEYAVCGIPYQPSDLLFFYTDGLQDAMYAEQPDEFTRQMSAVLSDVKQYESADEVLDTICENFYRVPDGEAKRLEMDDVSMILCRL